MKKLTLTLFTLALGLLVIESGLRVFTPYPIHGTMSNRVQDPILSYKLPPSLKGIDKNGFRNPSISDTIDLLAIGDSHTYGYNVRSEESWPQRVGQLSQQNVYNVGIPGYGILEYLHLFNQELKRQPQSVIIALYLPNDLLDLCETLATNTYWQDWAINRQIDFSPCLDTHRTTHQPSISRYIKTTLKKSALGSLLAVIRRTKILPRFPSQSYVQIAHPLNPTLLHKASIKGRREGTNLHLPPIKRAYEISLEVFRMIKERCDQEGIHLSVAFLPSKERSYLPHVQRSKQTLPPDFTGLIENETHLTQEFQKFLDRYDIPHTDVTPYLQKALERTNQVYLSNNDTHPGVQGDAAYADAIYNELIKARATN